MSVKEFSEALKSQALKSWFQRLSTDNILKMQAKDIRKKEAGKEFNSFYITEQTISDVIEKLTEAKAAPEAVKKVFQSLKKVTYGNKNTGKEITEPYVEGTALYYPRVSFDSINTILEKGFEDVLKQARVTNPDLKISDYFQRGHVFGIFPKKLAQTRKSLAANSTLTSESRALLVSVLEDLEAQLKAEDLATSNLKTPGYGLYAKYEKRADRYLVELQLKEVNEAAGRQQSTLSKAVRKYFDPGAVTFTAGGGIKFTTGEAEQRIKETIERNVDKLFQSKGSPSMEDLMVACIVDALQGKKTKRKTYTLPKTKVAESKAAKVDAKALNKKVKDDLRAVQKLKQSVLKVPRFTEPNTTDLSSLLAYLNSHLHDVVAANMGDGSSNNVLNYRTGRLATSTKVERLSQSREGMITAFYSYMKNPYATFSEGGAQSRPKSRDPKLLISKSIREIAAEAAVTKLRAVNV